MAYDFAQFDKSVDIEGLKKDVAEATSNGSGDFKEVPHGSYEVAITKLELAVSKKGNPMVTCWFKILDGDYKNSLLFMNQVVTQGFQIHLVDEFLRSLESGVEIGLDVAEAIDGNKEYAIEYGENKGFNTFKITDVFDVD